MARDCLLNKKVDKDGIKKDFMRGSRKFCHRDPTQTAFFLVVCFFS